MAKDLLKPERKKKDTDKHIGCVVSVDDSEELLRVQIRVQGKYTDDIPDEDLPWCEYALPPGNRYNEGTFIPVKPGDYVWVDFPYDGDVRRPRLVGSVHYCPDNKPNFPHEAWGGPDAVEHQRVLWESLPPDRSYFGENVLSRFGIVAENPENALILTHRATGTALEISENGDITLHGSQNIYLTAQGKIQMGAHHGIEPYPHIPSGLMDPTEPPDPGLPGPPIIDPPEPLPTPPEPEHNHYYDYSPYIGDVIMTPSCANCANRNFCKCYLMFLATWYRCGRYNLESECFPTLLELSAESCKEYTPSPDIGD